MSIPAVKLKLALGEGQFCAGVYSIEVCDFTAMMGDMSSVAQKIIMFMFGRHFLK